ncbi:LytTR family transcriptional regulator [Cereibacter sphaeroides]|uniref:LytTR family DNA-binding domain-containing protein n=1 Tax=Cereibacter sphaeroides TaxID=1063 RepID=UPI000F51BBA8|nr:LytTR family DNA-binding domain-containing protein [Cereibacter sphaeroides]AZB62919.1 LytTR family transcriptional regulator [Cereibacter sphaeroides]AZB69123.1 LytTR family transcriptional regulator [Cereibacter sphaeroides]
MSVSRPYAECLAAPLPWIVWAVASVGLAVSGPFGSYQTVALPERLLVWSALVAITLGLGLALRVWFAAVGLRDLKRGAGLALAVAGVLTLPIWWLMQLAFGPEAPSALEVAPALFCAGLGLSSVRLGGRPQPVPDGQPRLLQRMEPELRGALVSMTVRDHYVDVVTSAGLSSLLLRFSDAMDETEGVPGAQVHRSHWVAWSAVTGTEREPGKLFLLLSDGSRIPVSRAHRAKLEERGLV